MVQARDRGIYLAVMLFNGLAFPGGKEAPKRNPWRGHPFHRQNNFNGIDGDANGDESGEETHELVVPGITAIQESYVKKVIDTVNDPDNVLYEISNESHSNSVQWQYHMIRLIKAYEAGKPKQHPVGMSVVYPDGNNQDLLESPADWISPKEHQGDSLINKGKVVLDDTDHWFGIGGDRKWAWKRFMEGANPVFMDGYDVSTRLDSDIIPTFLTTNPQWTSLRLNLGYIQTYANRIDLMNMVPRGELPSTGYCLSSSRHGKAQFLVYIPQGNVVTLNLSGIQGVFSVEWFDPGTGLAVNDSSRKGRSRRLFRSPFDWESVLFLKQTGS